MHKLGLTSLKIAPNQKPRKTTADFIRCHSKDTRPYILRYNNALIFKKEKYAMKASQFFISTLKEAPAEAALASHKLMIRAGLIKANASGLYTWMPMGLRVLRKVENIVREEMAARVAWSC